MKRHGIIGVLLLLLGTMAAGDTVTYPLVGCEGTYHTGMESDSWTSTVDLGVTFSEITSVSIDWSGQMYGGLKIEYGSNGQDFVPASVTFSASLSASPVNALADIGGGDSTYPNPENFDCITSFSLWFDSTWDQWLDGIGDVNLAPSMISPTTIVEFGYVELYDATLIFEGTVIPEPMLTLLLVCGGFWAYCRKS